MYDFKYIHKFGSRFYVYQSRSVADIFFATRTKSSSISGICDCTDGFFGADCSIDITIAPVIFDTSLQIVCDGSCDTVLIGGQGFVQTEEITCHFTAITVCL